MYIVGNRFNIDTDSYLIILSSVQLPNYDFTNKTKVIDNLVIYQYKIKIMNDVYIKLGDKDIFIPKTKPQLNNTSLYFVSCDGQNTNDNSNPINVYNVKDNTDMWKKLYMDIKADTNLHKYVIHLGDQVYMDDAHRELIKNKATTDNYNIIKTYNNVYQTNYNNKYKQKILKSCYNIMIADDHEVVNNYKSIPDNLTSEMKSNALFLYKIYQEDLYGIHNHDIKHLTFQDFQIIIPNLRKYRQYNTNKNAIFPVIGDKQILEFQKIINNTGNNIKRTYYVSSTPLIGVNNIFAKIIDFLSNGNSDFHLDNYIASSLYMMERNYIMDQLFTLDNVIIIGGDYHFSECYNLEKNNKIILQIITSPISSDPMMLRYPSYQRLFIYILLKIFYDREINNINIDKLWTIFDYNYLKITKASAILSCYNQDNSKTIAL